MLEITQYRHNPLVDPNLDIWGLPVSAYLFLGGLVAGLMILNGFWRLRGSTDRMAASTRIGPIWAPILLSLGMFCLWLDLENKLNVYRFYLTFRIESPMSWGAWILILVYPAQILGMALPGGMERFPRPVRFLNPAWEIIKCLARKWQKAVSITNIVLGVMLGIYTGILLSTFAARPLWNTSILAPLFLISGLSTATAWNMLSKPTLLENGSLIRWDIGLLATEFVFLVLIVTNLASGTQAHQEAGKLILGGAYTASFWVVVVMLGIALPLWLEIREVVGRFVPPWTAPVLILLGGVALRIILVQAGQASHLPDTELLSTELP